MTLTNQDTRLTASPSPFGFLGSQLSLAATVIETTLHAFSAARAVDAEKELAKTLRREAARQATDKLLR